MAIKEIRGSKENLSRGFKDVGIGFLLNTFTKDAAVVKDANAIKQAIKNKKLFSQEELLYFKKWLYLKKQAKAAKIIKRKGVKD